MVFCLVAVFLALGALLSCRLLTPAPAVPAGEVAESGAPAVPARPTQGDLVAAAERGDLESARAIVERNPGLLEQVDAAGWNAATYAAWNGRKAVYDYLVKQGAAASVFGEAALGPLPALVDRLRTNPRAVDSRDGRHRASPLIWAVRTGNQVAAELLLDRGADADLPDGSGSVPLHAAVVAGNLEIGRLLLRAGASPGAADQGARTPLHLAAAAGELQFCVVLVEAGAAIAARDQDGNTALHLAAARGDFELCEYLLFLGAPAGIRNNRGLRAGDLAERQGHRNVAALLRTQESR